MQKNNYLNPSGLQEGSTDNQIDMAGFQTKTFSNHDDYMTPKSAWQNIAEYIPKDKQI